MRKLSEREHWTASVILGQRHVGGLSFSLEQLYKDLLNLTSRFGTL